MKKVYTLLFAASVSLGLKAQTYLSKDFDDQSATSGGWTIQDVSNPDAITSWTTGNIGSNNGTEYGKCTSYSGGNHDLVSWLISPSFDLSSSTSPMFSMMNAYNYTGDPIQIKVSTNYDGTSDPSTQGTWTDLTSQATLSSGNWGWVSTGNVDLSSYNSSSVYIAIIFTGTASGGSTWEIDDILVNEGGTTVTSPAAHSIYEIQNTISSGDTSYYKDSVVLTGGIVTAVRPDSRYYIQAGNGPWSGVYVYDNVNTVAIGDSVTMQATVDEYNNLTELKSVTNFANVSSNNPVPQTIVTTAQSMTEDYEGVLVTMQGATCTQATDGFGEWIINDNSGPSLISDLIYSYTAATGGPYEVTGVVDYAFGSFKVQPRMASDIVTNVTIPNKTIYEIQSTLVTGSDSSYYRDSIVFTGGIVTAVRTDGRYYIQAGSGMWSGIYVYDNVSGVSEGDSITLNAMVVEFNGLTELSSVSNLTVVNSGNTIPQTIVTSDAGTMEEYESVLITINTASCTSGTNGFGEWVINDGAGSCTVGDLMYAFTAVTNGTYTVTGILDYAFGNFVLQPRYAADVIDYTSIEENTIEVNIYPNPSNGTITIDAPVSSSFTLTDITGKVVYTSTIVNNNMTITDLSTGMYVAKVSVNGTTATSRVIVK